MGYRGKVREQARARELRAVGWTMPEIAAELGVSRSSVSLWVRDVPYTPRRPPRSGFVKREPNKLERWKQAEIERFLAEGRERIGQLTDKELLVAGTALYAGEGFKTRYVGMANTNPAIMLFFATWLRRYFVIEEPRLRVTLYLHDGLSLTEATIYWSELLDVPTSQFLKPYRPAAHETRRTSKHRMGCPRLTYTCSRTHRAVMGLVEALLASEAPFRGSSIGRAPAC